LVSVMPLRAGSSPIVWQEVVDNGVDLDPETLVHVWKWWWPVEARPGPQGAVEVATDGPTRATRSLRGGEEQLPVGPTATEASTAPLDGVPGYYRELERVSRKVRRFVRAQGLGCLGFRVGNTLGEQLVRL
jgi:hypothetical protein